jgi:hypothetical protein
VTQGKGQGLKAVRTKRRVYQSPGCIEYHRRERKLILIIQNIVVCGTARSQQPTMTLQVKVKFGWVRNISVNHSSSRTVTRSVTITLVLREKSNMMSLSNNNDSDIWPDLEI